MMKDSKAIDFLKILLSVLIMVPVILVGIPCAFLFLFPSSVSTKILLVIGAVFFPSLFPLVWSDGRKKYFIRWSCCLGVAAVAFFVPFGIEKYEESLIVNVTPNINVEEYLPFKDDSEIVKYDSKTLKLTEDLPIIDGATAAFPVYSAFVNAVYPNTTSLGDGVFEYNNTVGGYTKLAEKKTDIFLGAQPSKDQVLYAAQNGTEFEYTQIGSEAFVFFVHKNNPVESLTVEQIKGIYSGKITNWKEVGGRNEKIVAFQRNEGSGSQSMMLRFMGDTPLMSAEKKEVAFSMGSIIDEVVDYKNKSGSIGYSFRYYLEGIIKNPDIKMIAVEGVSPTVENIKAQTYPIVAPVYAVTYKGNTNPNVRLLIDWMLSEEGQYIIEKTGYVGVNK